MASTARKPPGPGTKRPAKRAARPSSPAAREPEPPTPATASEPSEPARPASWTALADLLLQRAALAARVAWDRAPDPLAGLKIDDDDVARILEELPGLQRGTDTADAAITATCAPQVTAALDAFINGADDGQALRAVAVSAGLDTLEAVVLAVLCAIESDPRRQRLVAYLNDDVTARRVTPFLLQRLFAGLVTDSADDLVRAVAPTSGLRRTALVSVAEDVPWASAPIAVAPAVLWWLAGDRAPEPGLPSGAEVIPGPTDHGQVRLATAAGPDRIRRLQAAVAALDATELVVAPLPATAEQWDALVRQATLGGYGVVLEVEDELPADAQERIERADHLAWAITSAHDLPLASLPRRAVVDVPVATPDVTLREWQRATATAMDPRHRITAEQLHLLGRVAGASEDVTGAIRRLAGGRLEKLATRIRPRRGFDDLVLDDDRRELLVEIIARSRHRRQVFEEWGFRPEPSTGVIALFSGPSGTGKTLAAEIIAGELDMDLYKVDISGLVSKYIGETEKNLSQVFDVAEASNVALFFDEADALLGKRSEVSDAHDRYANIEVAYLLQRMERYEGLVILASNLPKNIDPAFTRRIHVSVEFPMPEPPERRLIWERSLPPSVPLDRLDLDQLAEHVDLSGGGIRNAAVTAAFLAADAATPIDMDIVVTAIEREYRKQGRLFDAGPLHARASGGRGTSAKGRR